jgi:hypothetical protein
MTLAFSPILSVVIAERVGFDAGYVYLAALASPHRM